MIRNPLQKLLDSHIGYRIAFAIYIFGIGTVIGNDIFCAVKDDMSSATCEYAKYGSFAILVSVFLLLVVYTICGTCKSKVTQIVTTQPQTV